MPSSNPLLTIFTAPKPFTDPHIRLIQRNAILSWQHLGEAVQVLLVGDEPGMAEFACEMGIQQLAKVSRNDKGTPLVSSIFDLARQYSSAPLLAYVNADIVLIPEFVRCARQVHKQVQDFLVSKTGQTPRRRPWSAETAKVRSVTCTKPSSAAIFRNGSTAFR